MNLKGSAFRSKIFKGYASTYVVEFLVLISNLLVYRLCTQYFGSEGLAEIAIFKRIFAFIQPIFLFGLLVGLTRYVAHSKGKREQFQYFFTSFIFILTISLILITLMNVFSIPLSELFFNDIKFEKYILPLSLTIAGAYFHLMIYGYLRGKHAFMEANCLQALNMGIVPVIVFFLADTLVNVLFYNGIIWIVSSICLFIFLLFRYSSTKVFFKMSQLGKLLRYGLPRMPGDIAFGGLFALPIIIISHFQGAEVAGRMAFSLTFLNIMGAAFSPLSLMLLPTISQKLKDRKFKEARAEIKSAIAVTVLLSAIGVLIYEFFAEEILTIYLGEEISSWVVDTQIIMLGGVFYALFITLRSVIDAYYEKAINSLNLLISLGFFSIFSLIVGFMGYSYLYFYLIFIVSLFILVTLTLFSINKIQRELKLL